MPVLLTSAAPCGVNVTALWSAGEYDARKQRILAYESQLKDFQKYFNKYLDAARALCHASSEISGSVRDGTNALKWDALEWGGLT